MVVFFIAKGCFTIDGILTVKNRASGASTIFSVFSNFQSINLSTDSIFDVRHGLGVFTLKSLYSTLGYNIYIFCLWIKQSTTGIKNEQ